MIGDTPDRDVGLSSCQIDGVITHRDIQLDARVFEGKFSDRLREMGYGHGWHRELDAPTEIRVFSRHLPLRLDEHLLDLARGGQELIGERSGPEAIGGAVKQAPAQLLFQGL